MALCSTAMCRPQFKQAALLIALLPLAACDLFEGDDLGVGIDGTWRASDNFYIVVESPVVERLEAVEGRGCWYSIRFESRAVGDYYELSNEYFNATDVIYHSDDVLYLGSGSPKPSDLAFDRVPLTKSELLGRRPYCDGGPR